MKILKTTSLVFLLISCFSCSNNASTTDKITVTDEEKSIVRYKMLYKSKLKKAYEIRSREFIIQIRSNDNVHVYFKDTKKRLVFSQEEITWLSDGFKIQAFGDKDVKCFLTIKDISGNRLLSEVRVTLNIPFENINKEFEAKIEPLFN